MIKENTTMTMNNITASKIGHMAGNFTNILVVGGSYAALSFINNFTSIIQGANPSQSNGRKISITMIEPKGGFLNIIGMPRALLDIDFAKSQYFAFNRLRGIKFDNIYENENITKWTTTNSKFGLELNYIQGKVTKLDKKSAEYQIEKTLKAYSVKFDYVVLASGRYRSPPISPKSSDMNSFVNEASEFKHKVEKSDKISVIGAGAVGIEIAAEIKHYYPEKTVNLIHPYSLFPPEPLSDKFKECVHSALKDAGINIYLENRIEKELADGNLATVDGKIIDSQFNFWSSGKKNNTDMLSKEIKEKYVSEKGNLLTNEHLQLSNAKDSIKNFYCIGDIVEIPVIKTAGWAAEMGRICAANIFSLLLNKEANNTLPGKLLKSKNMVLVSGNRDIISESNGQAEINNPRLVEQYKDYCLSKAMIKLKL